jgi:hypothetical protein
MDEPEVHALIRAKLHAGLLPRRPPARIWSGRGTGARCAGCDQPIVAADVEIEIEVPPGSPLFFHRRCEAAWSAQRDSA